MHYKFSFYSISFVFRYKYFPAFGTRYVFLHFYVPGGHSFLSLLQQIAYFPAFANLSVLFSAVALG